MNDLLIDDSKYTMLTLKDVAILTDKSEGFIKSKIACGDLKKYDSYGNILVNPLQHKGFFKPDDVKALFNINLDFKKLTKKNYNNTRYIEKNILPREIIRISQKNIFRDLDNIQNKKFNVCIAAPNFDPIDLSNPYKYRQSAKETNYLMQSYEWIDKIYNLLDDNGSLLVHNIPRWLPYYATHLGNRMVFKYWIAINTYDIHAKKSFSPVATGILFMVKRNENFIINTLREAHRKCIYCGDILKDYGGKKHLMHKKGAALSDVWKYIKATPKKSTSEYKMPSVLLRRLINLSCVNDDRVLLAPFNGKVKL